MKWEKILKEDYSYGISLDAIKGMDWVNHMRKVLSVRGYENLTDSAIEDAALAFMVLFEKLLEETGYEQKVKESEEQFSEATRTSHGEKDISEPTEGKVGRGMYPKRHEQTLKTINRMIQSILQDLIVMIHKAWDKELLDEEDEEMLEEALEDKRLDDSEIEEIFNLKNFKRGCIGMIGGALKRIGEGLNLDNDTPLNTSKMATEIIENDNFKSWIAHIYALSSIKIQTGITRELGDEREQQMGDILTEEEKRFFESIDEGGKDINVGPFNLGRSGAEIDPSTGIPQKTATGEDIIYPDDNKKLPFGTTKEGKDWQEKNAMDNGEFKKAWGIIKKGRCKGCRPTRGILGEFW